MGTGIIQFMRSRQSLKIELELKSLRRHPHFAGAKRILETLTDKGFQTVLAGGCVRDSLLGVVPKDLDLATAAPPEVVEASFARTLAVGKAFGTIVVVEDGLNFEVTTFRKDGVYLDGRHPRAVEFSDAEEDAHRRDFTVNALFYDPLHSEVIDFVGGVADLKAKRLVTVGAAAERFGEDRLRMLRAVRFVGQLGFTLEGEALTVMVNEHGEIGKVSAERIFAELKRLLQAPFLLDGLTILRKSGLFTEVWPEIGALKMERLAGFLPLLNWENTFATVALLTDSEAALARLKAWKAPREGQRRVEAQMEGCRTLMNPDTSRATRARILGGENFAEILLLAQGFLSENQEIIQRWIEDYLVITGPGGILPKPLLNGQDLIAAGIPPGEKMGALLKALYEDQLEGNLVSKDQALKQLKSMNI